MTAAVTTIVASTDLAPANLAREADECASLVAQIVDSSDFKTSASPTAAGEINLGGCPLCAADIPVGLPACDDTSIRWHCNCNTWSSIEELRRLATKRLLIHEDADGEHWSRELAPAALYGLPGDVVGTLAPHTEADPAAILAQFLAHFGANAGAGIYYEVEDDCHPPRHFPVLVGPTSKGRKGTSASRVRQLFIGDGLAPRTTGLSSGEGLIWAVRDEIRKMQPIKEKGRVVDYQEVVEDPGVSDKRLIVEEPEFARTLKTAEREGNTLSAVIRLSWDTGNLNTLTKNSAAKATGAHISIIGHISKEELRRRLTETEVANGYGNRHIWFYVRRRRALPFGGNLKPSELQRLQHRTTDALGWARNQSGGVTFDEEAAAIWGGVYRDLSSAKPGLAGALIARAEAQVMRLALTYAIADKSLEIRAEHLKAALAVQEYVEASVNYIYGSATGDPLADDVHRALVASGANGLTRTELHGVCRNHAKTGALTRALETLEQRGLAYCATEDGAGTKPVERWYTT